MGKVFSRVFGNGKFFRLNLLDLVCLLKIIFKYFANLQAGVWVIFSLCDLVP